MAFDKERFKNSISDHSHEYFSGRYVFSNIGTFFARFLVRLPITPNQLTWFWGGLMVLSSLLFSTGKYELGIIAAVIWIAAYALDYSDGIIARYKGLRSPRGAFLDMIVHRLTYPMLMFCIGYGVCVSATGYYLPFDFLNGTVYICLGLAAGVSMLLFMDATPLYEKYKEGDGNFEDRKGSMGVEGKSFKNQNLFKKLMNFNPLVFTNMMLMLLVFAALDAMSVFIILYGLGYSLATTGRILLLYKDL